MDNFKITIDGAVTFISNEAADFLIKIEKNRKLTVGDGGKLLEVTLYKEDSTFVPECNYVFEAVETEGKPADDHIDIPFVKNIVEFFFHSVLDTTYFITRVPQLSKFDPVTVPNEKNDNAIDTSNLYELLSGY